VVSRPTMKRTANEIEEAFSIRIRPRREFYRRLR